jgi:hypothetical protein
MSEIPIVKATLAYDNPMTGETLILILEQALYFGNKLSHILLNPNQIRFNGVEVDDALKFLAPKDKDSMYSIYFPKEGVRIPLMLEGCLSIFNICTPMLQEIHECPNLLLADHNTEWDPHSTLFKSQEESYEDAKNHPRILNNRKVYSLLSSCNPSAHNSSDKWVYAIQRKPSKWT